MTVQYAQIVIDSVHEEIAAECIQLLSVWIMSE